MRLAVAGFALVVMCAGCTSKQPQPVEERAPLTVTLARAGLADVPSRFEAGGIVRASATALIASRVMAPVTHVHVRAGDRVRRGAVLVTLDARELRANGTRAVATSLSASEAARGAEADVRAADSALVLARATHERMATLHAKRSATAEELDHAVAALAAAEAQAAGARARLAAASAAREAAQAGVQSAEIGTTYSVLVAPFDAIVAARATDPGSMATPGTPLLTLEDPSRFRFEAPLDEARAALVAVGQTAEIRFDNSPMPADEWIRGRISEIVQVDPASHSFLVKVDLPPGAWGRSGLFGRARFAGPSRRALIVPGSALVNRGQLTFVYMVDSDGRARLRPISVGPAEDDRVEVLAGVGNGDVIVMNPPASLADGVRVAGVRQ